MQRKKINVFSLSFLDCICCGLGAVILLFVIVNAKSAVHRDKVTSNLRGEVDRIEKEVLHGKKGLVEVRNTLDQTRDELVKAQGLSRRLLDTIEEKKRELAHYENETLATKEHINRLKTDLKSMEEGVKRLEGGSKARDDYGAKLRRFPGTGDRQYLTDLKMGGKRIFILVDASASMLDETIVGVIRRRNLPDKKKVLSEKWQQAVDTVDWLVSQLPQTSKFQVYRFNETAAPVISGTRGKWLDAGDVEVLNNTVSQMKTVVPQKGTSLVNGFKAMGEMKPAPDNIFLLVDSLPTMGISKPSGKRVSGKKRLNLFNTALNQLSPNVPINIILYPMEGDPIAVSAYWRLAIHTKGSFFSPSTDWP
jgi:hypothetical protein